MARPSESERRRYVDASQSERSSVERYYGIGRHPASLGYRRGNRRERRREIRNGLLLLGVIVAVGLGIWLLAVATGRG